MDRVSSAETDMEKLRKKEEELETKEDEVRRLSSFLEISEKQGQALIEEQQRQRQHNEDLEDQMDQLMAEALRFRFDVMKAEKEKDKIKLELENLKSTMNSARTVENKLHKFVSMISFL